ncbi:hypothetical protein HC752_23340 [Vibrio sp. S9_S30]|uniref:hypothetical protein n=1 Tax=Vibrio sp. S9_S30 TaxID=2720226 RepID=UPI001681311D|nr:hypothetical protein [Vibrio sp. S9_S30]MBD1559867.1 hypothetical protein [Vibrio sp. S9_S30]
MSNTICPTLIGITFDEESQQALNAINDMKSTVKDGWVAIVIGQLAVIFGGLAVKPTSSAGFIESTLGFKLASNDVTQTAYNIYQTNWEYFFKSLSSLDRYANNQISTTAGLQMIRSRISPKERQFWKALHYGCKF